MTGGTRPRPEPPGLQAERTWLSWRRTALSVTVVAVLAVRFIVHRLAGPAEAILLVAVAAGWAAALATMLHRAREMVHTRPVPAGRTITAIALVALGFTVLGILLVVDVAQRP